MQAFRIALRLSVLLCLGAATISLVALGAEYPGASAANRRALGQEPLPLALLAWAHLGVLEATRGRVPGVWTALALGGDFVLLVRSAMAAHRGAAPLAAALPGVALLLLGCAVGVVWQTHRAGVPSSPSAYQSPST